MFKTQINRLLLAVVLFNLCAVIGCHRGYYRRQADADAKRLILQKSVDPRWNTASGTIDINPQSRMFDPFSADHPPIPPDDATSHQLMHWVDGKPGYPQWNANGDTNYVENPEWRAYLPVNEQGQVVLSLDRAFQLALIHSPEYQEARETLYLSALDVSLDRFGFDSQLFAGYNSFFSTQGRLRNGSGNSSSTLSGQLGANGGGINLNRLGITGTNFAVGLANTILFNFSGNDTQSATTLVDFSIIQPLLRGAGRDRIMASLTQSERTLLANVRQLERFRRAFYLQIAVGRNISASLSRNGNFLNAPGFAGLNAGGFFGLLQAQQNIRNQELNVRQLEAVLALFREFFLRERLDAVQLKLFETSVYGQQRTLLNLRIAYQTTLDQYKRTLGLPPELDVVIDDTYLDGFALISDQINEQLILTSALREEIGNVLNGVDSLFDELVSVDDIGTEKFKWPSDLAEKINALTPYLEKAESTLEQIVNEDRAELEEDLRNLGEKREARLAYLDKLRDAIQSGKIDSPVDPGLFETKSLPKTEELLAVLSNTDSSDSILSRAAKVKEELATIKTRIAQFKQTESELEKKQLYEFVRTEFQQKIPGQLSEINNLILEISLLQARTRSNSIEIIDVDIESAQAIEIARCMRRDWMNARASLVDNWRNIEFVADQLESQLDLVFQGDVGNTGDNPFKIRYETGQLRAGFRFDAPIVRLAERNNYRAALISYQQTRRQFYQFEDSIKQNLREIDRNIDRNKVAFELDRRTVQVQIESVEINRYELEKPVGPGGTGGGRLGATTAQNLAQAIIGLNNAQNAFLGSWVGYEVLRRNLDFDMGTMQLDERGQWIDPGTIDASIGQLAAAMMGIELDCQFCTGVVAPGGIAADLISDGAPSVIQPQTDSIPTESEIPVPIEIEKIEQMDNSPQLNRPESGMRLRRSVLPEKSASASRSPSTPGLLFTPVASRIKPMIPRSSESSPPQPPVQVKSNPAPSDPAPADPVKKPLADSPTPKPDVDSQWVEAVSESNLAKPDLSQLVQKRIPRSRSLVPLIPLPSSEIRQETERFQGLPEPDSQPPRAASSADSKPIVPEENLMVATKIADQISDPLVKQTSGISPATSRVPEDLNSDKLPGSADHGPNQQEDNWQSRPSSLGGVLNRFRTGSAQ